MVDNSNLSNFMLAVDKPANMSSHDVVYACRKIFPGHKVGHMGTLDPLATGILLIGVGQSTRLNQFLENLDKTYIVKMEFGKSTSTYDAEGEIISKCEVPKKINDKKFAEKYVSSLVGRHKQIPPIYSAVKINGKPAYKQARKGIDINIPERNIEIYNTKLLSVEKNIWNIMLHVSKGTYVRSIVNDIGKDLLCGAYVSKLRRSHIASVGLENAYKLEDLDKINLENLAYINICDLLGFDTYELNDNELSLVLCGRKIDVFILDNKCVKNLCVIMKNKLYGIYKLCDSNGNSKCYRPICVFNNGIYF